MKKILLFLCFCVLFSCDKFDKNTCQQHQNIVWSDKKQTIQTYNKCINKILSEPNPLSVSLTHDQIDAMLYLSYIYLTDDNYKDIKKANNLINIAKKAIWQECDDYHGHYDNFCYFQYYKNDIPTYVNNLEDAIIIYQMTLPCVYIDMIQENENALKIIDGWFGSSRDVNIPNLCDTFDSYHIVNIDDISNLKSYTFLTNLNKNPETDGTMWFGLQRMKYHDLIYMLTYPQKYFKTDKFKDIYIEQYDTDQDIKTKIFATQIEKEIDKYSDLKEAYKNLQNSIKNHYISFLKMDADKATNYAHMTASMVILQDIFIK